MDDNTTNPEEIGTALAFLGLLPLLIVFFVWLVSAIVAAFIADYRDRDPILFGVSTFFFLGPLGVGFALIAPRGGQMDAWPVTPATERRKVADGRQRFVCPRCGAENDIPDADTSYDCWRCDERRNVKPKLPTAAKH